jgi:hypothetical protein
VWFGAGGISLDGAAYFLLLLALYKMTHHLLVLVALYHMAHYVVCCWWRFMRWQTILSGAGGAAQY